ncbi:MAG: transglycosylase SLT domain-containing protein [Burkholderiaceae bacterium]
MRQRPMPFQSAVIERAQAIGLDPAYVYGLIRQESRFIMDARSHVGASGLDAGDACHGALDRQKDRLTDFRPEQLNQRDTNIAIGTAYLKLALDDFATPCPGRRRLQRRPGPPAQLVQRRRARRRHLGRERAFYRDARSREEGAGQHHQLRSAYHRPAPVACKVAWHRGAAQCGRA